METYDIAVIGMGPGGEAVAGSLARAGLSVLGVDNRLVGGECPYWGCIPSKMMVRGADALAEARRVGTLSGSVGEVRPDFGMVAERIRAEATDDWDDAAAVKRFTDAGGVFVRGTGRLASKERLEVDGTMYAVRRGIVVNTGSAPVIPPIEGLDEVEYWTNHEVMEARELPASVVVLGGGAIGCEMAQVMSRFGSSVTVVEAAEHLLPPEEPEAGDILRRVFEAEGITVHTGVGADRVASVDGGVRVTLADGTEVTAERIVVATGRRADPEAVGLHVVGVDPAARVVPVDERCRVTDGVWAVGDITGKGGFTHVSMYQSGIVTRDVLGEDGPPADYRAVPHVTFTDPEVGSVGLTERAAREQLDHVLVGSTPVPETSRGWIHQAGNEGIIKVVADADRGVLVGATSMGPSGGEVLGALAVAVKAQVPVATLTDTIWAYPTFHRGIGDALGRLA